MAAIIGKYEEQLSTDNVLKMTEDNIQIKNKKFAMEVIGNKHPVVYSDLVVLIDPTRRLKKRRQCILVMTTKSFHILEPEFPYQRLEERPEIPLLWIEKIYADRIDGQIIFQIRPHFDLWVELYAKTHFIHVFSMLHKLRQVEESLQVNLEVKFVFDIANSPDVIYISKAVAKRTKEYTSAKERVEKEAQLVKEKYNGKSKNETAMSAKKSDSPRKKKGFGVFSSSLNTSTFDKKTNIVINAKGVKMEKKSSPSKISKISSVRKKQTKQSEKGGGALSIKDIDLGLKKISFDKEIIAEAMKAIDKSLKSYERLQKAHIKHHTIEHAKDNKIDFGTFENRIFSNYEFDHFTKGYEMTINEDIFLPKISLLGQDYSVRKLEIRSGVLSNKQKFLLGIEGSKCSDEVKLNVMKYKGSFEHDEKSKLTVFSKKSENTIKRFKYYFMEPVSMNLQILLDQGKFVHGLPYNYAVSISKQILQVFQVSQSRDYSLTGLTLRDIYLVKDKSNEYNQVKIFNFNHFKGLSCKVIREQSRFEDICTCPKELLEQAFLQYDIETLTVSPEMDFWTYGVILFRLLTGEYPYPKVTDPLSPSELYSNLSHESYNPSVHINHSNIDHPPAKFLLRKLLGQDPLNLDINILLKDDFFDPNSTVKSQDY